MKEQSNKDIHSKKIWNKPTLISLNVKKTFGGPTAHQTEDYASGTINTQPNS
jgi:hypothetical protein